MFVNTSRFARAFGDQLSERMLSGHLCVGESCKKDLRDFSETFYFSDASFDHLELDPPSLTVSFKKWSLRSR